MAHFTFTIAFLLTFLTTFTFTFLDNKGFSAVLAAIVAYNYPSIAPLLLSSTALLNRFKSRSSLVSIFCASILALFALGLDLSAILGIGLPLKSL